MGCIVEMILKNEILFLSTKLYCKVTLATKRAFEYNLNKLDTLCGESDIREGLKGCLQF